MKQQLFFSNKNNHNKKEDYYTIPKVEHKIAWIPPPARPDEENYLLLLDNYNNEVSENIHKQTFHSKLSRLEKFIADQLCLLNKRQDIVIKPADKNLGTCLLSSTDYLSMCLNILSDSSTYLIVTHYYYNQVYAKLRLILIKYDMLYDNYTTNFYKTKSQDKKLSKLALSLLQLQLNPDKLRKTARFYILPKVHKSTVVGRPIVSAINTVTYHTSLYLNNILQPLVKLLPTVCQSSKTVIKDIEGMSGMLNDYVIACADIKSLYPSIPIEYGLHAVKSILISTNFFTDRIDLILDLLHWVLTNNYLDFNNTIYKQIFGTSMGTPVSVVYSNIVIFYLEQPLLLRHHTIYYKRYIDDLFIIFASGDLANNFLADFQRQVSSIQLDDITIGRKGIFLDLEITIQTDGTLDSQTYQKAINKYLYIPPLTSHDRHVIDNFIGQELKRYRLQTKNDGVYYKLKELFRQRLLDRGYNKRYLAQIYKRFDLPRSWVYESQIHSRSKRDVKTALKPRPILIINIPRTQVPLLNFRRIFSLPRYITSLSRYKAAYDTTSSNIIIAKQYGKSIGRILGQDEYSGCKKQFPSADQSRSTAVDTAEGNPNPNPNSNVLYHPNPNRDDNPNPKRHRKA